MVAETLSSVPPSAFERLFGALPLDVFLSEFFNKKPLFVRGSPERFEDLFSQDKFFSCLKGAGNVRAVFKDLKQATIHADDAQDMIEAGATICAEGIEQCDEQLMTLVEAIRQQLNYAGRVSIRAYYSPPGAGFDIHYDTRVATTLQISGSKKWSFSREAVVPFPTFNSPYPLSEDLNLKLKECGKDEVLLNPGDLFCIPAGTLHWADAQTASLALNLAFDYLGAGLADLIAEKIRRELRNIPEFRDTIYGNSSNESVAAQMTERVKRASRMVREMLTEDILGTDR